MKTKKLLNKSSLVYAFAVLFLGILSFAVFFNESRVEAQNKTSGEENRLDIFNEKKLGGQKVPPVVQATTTFKDIVEYEKTYTPPTLEYVLQSKGKRPRNPPAEEMPAVPDSIVKKNPNSFFDFAKISQQNPLAPQAASPSPNLDFQGLNDANTSIPPDTHGAVGPNHIMTALNTQVRIQSKTGTTSSTVSLNSFFASVGGGGGTFDPRVLYDPYQNRWICVAVDDAANATSKVLIAVSQTNDPTGTWNFYGYDHDTANIEWADYPMVGFNKNWIAVSINDFAVAGNTFAGANTYIFDKSTLYAGAVAPTVTKVDIGTALGNVHQPVETYDNTTETLYVIQRWNSTSGNLRIYTITGTPAAPTFTATSLFPTSTGWSTTSVNAPQSGTGAVTVTNNDSRLQRVVLRNGSIWAAHTIFLTTPSRTSVQWWQFNPVTAAVNQMGRIDDPTGTNFYAFPSIAVNAANQALVGYSAFSATTFPSAAYSYRGVTDAATTMRDPLRYKNGLACYRKTFGGTTNRWGDYSNTVVDPTDDTTFWTLQQYSENSVGGDCTVNNTGRWGVWWAKVIPPCASIVASGNWNTAGTWGCGGVPTAADDAVIVTGQTVNLDVNPVAASVTVNQGGTLAVTGTRTATTNITVNGTLDLTGGILDMGANTLTIGCGGSVSGASASGYVIGNIRKDYCAESGASFVYPTGDAGGNYSPFSVANLSGTGNLTASVTDALLPDLNALNSASRFWTLSGSGVTADLTFTYVNGDIVGTEASYKVYRRSGGINTPISPFTINPANNTATVTGISSFSDWGVGNVATAAAVSVSGRVVTAAGTGIRNVSVSIVGANGVSRTVQTNSFGNYRFDAIASGENYVVSVSNKKYTFANPTRVLSVQENVTDADFVAESSK